MTAPAPQPMTTPDLAGLLKRPSASPQKKSDAAVPPTPVTAPAKADTVPAERRTRLGERADAPAPAASPVTTSRGSGEAPADKKPAAEKPHRAGSAPSTTVAAASVDQPNAVTKRAYLRPIAIYMPRSVHQALAQHAAAQSTTATATILTAVSTTHDQLGSALTRPQPRPAAGSLFDVPQARPKTDDPHVTTTIRVTDAQHQAMQDLTARYGVSRSEMITAALRTYLSVRVS